jgi:phage baseplate assembly protein W
MAGIDRFTGAPLDGWPHVAQSLGVLFTTPHGSRVMRRHVGSKVPRLIDSPISPNTIIDFYAAVAEAVTAFEPRFKVSRMKIDPETVGGHLVVAIQGVYYPRGHLGDYSVSEPKTVSVPL